MRARWLVVTGIGATMIATAVFVACANGPSPGRPPEPTAAPLAGPLAGPPSGPPAGAAPPASVGRETADAGPDAAAVAQGFEAARNCDQPRAVIRNHPDGGVVFNNAMTSEDAGSLDRMQVVIDAMAGRGDAFRCCFDHWLAREGRTEVGVMLQVALDPAGAVESASLDTRRSSGGDEALAGCLAAIVREMSFPPSPSGNPTLVEYPFDVVAGEVSASH